jgi:hypothetical protein
MSEDWEMLVRLIDSDCKIAAVLQPLTVYRQHAGTASTHIARMERHMLLLYDELFEREGRSEILAIRRRAYANLRRVLAGSYFAHRDYWACLRNCLLSVHEHPASLIYLAPALVRVVRRSVGRAPSLFAR